MQTVTLDVEHQIPPVRIDRYIAERIAELSRNRIQQLIEAGSVRLNDALVERSSEKVKTGDRITLLLPPPVPSEVSPEPIDLEFLYEDAYLAVVNKPPGMCVHPTEQIKSGTLVNALLFHVHDLSGIGGVLRPGIVHRLDRGTSGVLLVAKQDETHRRLSDQFKARHIRKIYWALVHGVPLRSEGEIDLPIGRHPADRKRMAVRTDGRDAKTGYRVLQTGLGGSWLEVYPVTGRTHQIRVHFQHLGCPVVHDSIYRVKNRSGRGELERGFSGYPGIALHARSLRFQHPITGSELYLEAPLPERFSAMVDRFKS